MFCHKCGANIAEGAVFCHKCGTPFESAVATKTEETMEPPNQQEESPIADTPRRGIKLPRIPKKVLLFGVPAVLVVVLAVVIGAVLSQSHYVMEKGSVYILQADDRVIITTARGNTTTINGYYNTQAIADYLVASLDGTKAAALIGEEPYVYRNAKPSDLYYITNKPHLIASDVRGYTLAALGSAVAYSNAAGELWLYDGKKATQISSDWNSYVLSPDGKAVLYSSEDDRMYLWNGKKTLIGSDLEPVAVSSGSKYIYFMKDDFLHVQKGLNDSTREKLGDDIDLMYFNQDMSQVIFEYNERACLSRNGGSRQPLSGKFEGIVLPESAALVYYNLYDYGNSGRYTGVFGHDWQNSGYGYVYVLGVADFKNTLYFNGDDAVVRINSRYEAESVAKNIESYDISLSEDGKTLAYLKNDRLYRMNVLDANAEPLLVNDEKIYDFKATYDGGATYYVNYDSEIYFQKSTSKPVSVVFDKIYNWGMFKNNSLYYISGGDLYVSSGDKGKMVRGIDGKVIDFYMAPSAIRLWANDGDDILHYRSTDGKIFNLMYREINAANRY